MRSIYHGYVQIAEIDATDETAPYVAKTYRWKPVATRPLALTLWTREGTARETLYYAHDLRKNVVSLFDAKGLRRASYQYAPYGNITSMEGDMAEENPFRFSSEHHDEDLGLVYYNYRHYNPTDGRWISRDPIAEEGGWNLYGFVANNPVGIIDELGLTVYAIDGTDYTDKSDGNVVKFAYAVNELGYEPCWYWDGPREVVAGSDSAEISNSVYQYICSQYLKKPNDTINLVGWSRGAAIAVDVAQKLAKYGCGSGENKVYPTINWMGLFDPVDMTFCLEPDAIPSNVTGCNIIIADKFRLIFPKLNPKWSDSTNIGQAILENGSHNDVGGDGSDNKARNEAALSWMLEKAHHAGVRVNPGERLHQPKKDGYISPN